jgi:hypothetical protein
MRHKPLLSNNYNLQNLENIAKGMLLKAQFLQNGCSLIPTSNGNTDNVTTSEIKDEIIRTQTSRYNASP